MESGSSVVAKSAVLAVCEGHYILIEFKGVQTGTILSHSPLIASSPQILFASFESEHRPACTRRRIKLRGTRLYMLEQQKTRMHAFIHSCVQLHASLLVNDDHARTEFRCREPTLVTPAVYAIQVPRHGACCWPTVKAPIK